MLSRGRERLRHLLLPPCHDRAGRGTVWSFSAVTGNPPSRTSIGCARLLVGHSSMSSRTDSARCRTNASQISPEDRWASWLHPRVAAFPASPGRGRWAGGPRAALERRDRARARTEPHNVKHRLTRSSARRYARLALLTGIASLSVCAIAASSRRPSSFHSYLFAFVFWRNRSGLSRDRDAPVPDRRRLGSCPRRVARAGTPRCRSWRSLRADPLRHRRLYEWSHAMRWPRPSLAHKAPYLNVPFFVVRTVLYFAAWLAIANLLNRWSLEQDRTADGRLSRKPPAPLLRRAGALRPDRGLVLHRLGHVARAPLVLDAVWRCFSSPGRGSPPWPSSWPVTILSRRQEPSGVVTASHLHAGASSSSASSCFGRTFPSRST